MLAVEVEMVLFACLLLWMCVFSQEPSSKVVADRYAVFWNRTNAKFHRGDYHIDVCINDYLDVYCPHYEETVPEERTERYVLYMAPLPQRAAQVLEKFQLFTPFSLGFEFRPGREYYYISSTIAENGRKTCLKLRVYVRPSNGCIKTIGVHDRVFDVNDKVDNTLEPRDDTSHESAEPSRSEETNAASHLQKSSLLALLLACLVVLHSL
ncbi:hypothetical protein WMY93_004323 [Mugilogobius chulae]|uniref:EPH-related receptor tyrosine kinase ligand 7 n=1 Tax=Mugilogobius chulae TaxID=88201 RepID=A0AAW0PND3_9GOBI